MGFTDVIKNSVIKGFTSNDMQVSTIIVILGVTFLVGAYIFAIYRLVNRTTMYDKNFHIAMAMISVITAGIIVAMQSSIVISLGMVGALSIVRFRTAIKDTMDLLFLFWSIGEGIICGAGLFEVAIIVALMVTVGIFLLEFLPTAQKHYLLIINSQDIDVEDKVVPVIKEKTTFMKAKSRNIKKSGADLIFEVRTKQEKELLSEIMKLESVGNVSLLSHEGEVRF